MTSRIERARRWVNDLIDELTSENGSADAPRAPPPPSSLAVIEPRVSATPSVRPAPVPARKRARRPADNAETRRAARIVEKSKAHVIGLFEDVRLGRAVDLAQIAPVVVQLSREVEQNASALLEVLRLKSKSEYTYLHSVAVSALMLMLGRAMGYEGKELSDLGLGGLLHDIGKMRVAPRILDKPAALTDTEFACVKAHPQLGHAMLLPLTTIPEIALNICLSHHEKMDGSGYPFGRRGEEISVAARMGAICDVYDALTSDRSYKSAWLPDHALQAMRDWPGHFDHAILSVFMQALRIFPPGSLVRIRNQNLGIVLRSKAESTGHPVVRTFYSIDQRCRLAPEDVAIREDGLLMMENPSHWPFDDWEDLSSMLMTEKMRIPK